MSTNDTDLILDGTKIAWHQERFEAWKRGERIAPITIDMALTRACNFSTCPERVETFADILSVRSSGRLRAASRSALPCSLPPAPGWQAIAPAGDHPAPARDHP